MVTGSEKRVARLAVSRFGADGARVKEALQTVLDAQARGEPADFLETLVAEKLLNPAQADELRLAFAKTQIDLARAARAAASTGNGEANHAESSAPAAVSDPPTAAELLGFEPRAIGNYRILRRLGEGGMGSVFLAYQEKDKCPVAIKILSDQLAGYQASVDRFYREARSGALLDHPNIVRNLTVGQDRVTNRHYLVMEYVDGPSAHALLDEFGHLEVGDAVHVALDVARALEHAHSRNIVHRDIKPDNILITRSGVAKLADLGLAKRTDETSHLTAARQGFGTPHYMPYEQAVNAKSVDGRSDIYALGATLYHLATGEVPFPGTNHVEILEKKELGFFTPASSLNPAVPEALDRILDRMLARDPKDRYQTASELIVDLERSNLAAQVPSFADLDLALKDPVVRARLASPAQATCPDLERPAAPEERPVPTNNHSHDVWFLRYRDAKGHWCKARASTRQVLERLREGQMPPEVEASHQSKGKFQPLRAFPEFRAAALKHVRRPKPARAEKTKTKRLGPAPKEDGLAAQLGWWLAGLGLGLALVGGAIAYLLS